MDIREAWNDIVRNTALWTPRAVFFRIISLVGEVLAVALRLVNPIFEWDGVNRAIPPKVYGRRHVAVLRVQRDTNHIAVIQRGESHVYQLAVRLATLKPGNADIGYCLNSGFSTYMNLFLNSVGQSRNLRPGSR